MFFHEEARMNSDLLWDYIEGGEDRAYEESASIEVDPVGIARDYRNENPYL